MKSNETQSRVLWRSFDELESNGEFEQFLHREFPIAAAEFPKGVSRRRWLQLMGASFALGGLSGCRFENSVIAPLPMRPENMIPGKTKKYATTIEWNGQVAPLMVTTVDGRPIKADGHPEHPLMKGGSNIWLQASTLSLYDPDRTRKVRGPKNGKKRNTAEPQKSGAGESGDWDQFFAAARASLSSMPGGKGVVVVSAPIQSPSIMRLKKEWLAKYPESKWYEYETVHRDHERAGLKSAYGKPLRPVYDFSQAKVVVNLDADPLFCHATAISNARGWSEGRDVDSEKISRTYCIESQYSVTGTAADHRWPMRSKDIPGFVAALSAAVSALLGGGTGAEGSTVAEKRLLVIAKDLVANQGASLVVAGALQPAEVHAAVAKINDDLKNVGKTVRYIADPRGDQPGSADSLKALAAELNGGSVGMLLLLDVNPAYDAPSDLKFLVTSRSNQASSVLKKAALSIHLGQYEDETGSICHWHLPLAHPFEVWSDSIAADGSYCLGQPLIQPLFGSLSIAEVLARLLESEQKDGLEIVRATANLELAEKVKSELQWNKLVHDGFLRDSASSAENCTLQTITGPAANDQWKQAEGDGSLEIIFVPSNTLFDGRMGNNGWLQELPDPLTKVTWDNVAILAPETAKKLSVSQGSLVRISTGESEIRLPAFLQPGQAIGSIGVALGFGRREAGFVGGSERQNVESVGVNANLIRSADSWFALKGARVLAAGETPLVASTQNHHAIDVVGKKEIQRRWSELVRQGEYKDYVEFRNRLAGAPHTENHSHHEGTDEHQPDEHKHQADEHKSESGSGHEQKTHHATQWPEIHSHDLGDPAHPDLTPGPTYSSENVWAMGIDLNKCIGCNACITACQAENNIPIVGKEQVAKGRELHWLRIDRYLASSSSHAADPIADPEPEIHFLPVTCQHCETAPCETVCPVAATSHSYEGLNDMAYNRCIGTRYCGNNCPFKVRRFNYLNYSDATTFVKYPNADRLSPASRALQAMVMNPEVTVRSRGVMEKCTFCVQRIQNTKILARNENRSIGLNEIRTACQDACPTNAIVFGDKSRTDSDVAKAHASPRSYTMLDVLNIRPRTKYLARVRNSNPQWPPMESGVSREAASV